MTAAVAAAAMAIERLKVLLLTGVAAAMAAAVAIERFESVTIDGSGGSSSSGSGN